MKLKPEHKYLTCENQDKPGHMPSLNVASFGIFKNDGDASPDQMLYGKKTDLDIQISHILVS